MILDRLLGKLASKGAGQSPTSEVWPRWFGGGRNSAAGATVTEGRALSLSAVFAAVNLLSRVEGALPLHVYRQTGDAKNKATDLPAYSLLHHRPNPWMTASVFRRTLEWSRLIYGAAAAEIQYAGNGQPAALWPIEGWRVKPDTDSTGDLIYRVDQTRIVSPADMLYIPLVSEDGICGRSFLDFACESLGLSITAQEFAARFFGNGARPGGLLMHDGHPNPTARKEMRESWNAEHQGGERSHRVGVLWGGWKFDREAGAIAPDEAQLLETRKFGTQEVARWLNIQPHLLAELTDATFSNIEEQGINFIVYSLGPILVEYEQEYDCKLLDPPNLFSRHNLAALARGNMAARSAYYGSLFNIGVFSINDILSLEDMNPVDGGDQHFVPLNMAPLGKAQDSGDTPPAVDPLLAPPPDGQAEPPKNTQDAAQTGDVQATALNGAQITALLEIAKQQAADQLSKEASRAMIQAAFPLIAADLVDKIVSEIDGFEPPSQPPSPAPGPTPPTPEQKPPSDQPAMRALLLAVLDRTTAIEGNAIRRAAEKPGRFLGKMDEFYQDAPRRMAEALAPVLAVCRPDQDAGALATAIGNAWCRASHDELLELAGTVAAASLAEAVDKCLLTWAARRVAPLVDAALKGDSHAADAS